MPQKIFTVGGLGPVLVVKRRGAKNVRLTITPAQIVKVTIPTYVPYGVGVSFASKKADWINQHKSQHPIRIPANGSHIGKSHRLIIIPVSPQSRLSTAIKQGEITIRIPEGTGKSIADEKIRKACEKALKIEAEHLLPMRLGEVAKKYNFKYQDVKIKKLKARWGSCSSHQLISLSIYMMQLPWHLIDYVLIHELVHTRHMHHQKDFWDAFEAILPSAKQLRRELKSYDPVLMPE